MNEILNVNLGGYPFTIDNDAYHQINKYLNAIQRHFADSDGCDEILDDIEARMAELFTEFLQGKQIITLKELDAVIKVMGKPEDFGAESYDDEDVEDMQKESTSFKDRYSHIKTGKRFYRDPEEKVIGGVCGGIAAYFGIENPMWIRLGFIALIFIGGIPIIIYPILWAIVPEAKTAGDKLKMRGEPATVSNIARTVEQELNELSDKITEMSKDLGSKKKIDSNFFSPGRAISTGISLIGKVVLGVINILKAVIKPFFSFFLGIMLLVLGVFWVAWLITCISTFPFLNYLGPSPFLFSSIGGLAIFSTVAIPILGLMLVITRWFSSYRIPEKWRTNMRIGWVASFVIALLSGFGTAMSFNHEADLSDRVEYSINADVLNITRLPAAEHKAMGFVSSPFPNLTFTKAGLVNEIQYVEIVKSETDDFVVETKMHSQGKSFADAQNLVKQIEIEHSLGDNILKLPKEFIIKRGNKFRAQHVKYIVHVPEGKNISFDKSMANIIRRRGAFRDGISPKSIDLGKYIWTMTDKGLASIGWDKEYKAERFIDSQSLENLNIDGRLATTIQYGEKTELLLKGEKKSIDKIEKIETDGTTSLIVEGWIGDNVTLEITTPKLSSLHAKGLKSLKIEGFKQKDMELNFSGASYGAEMKAYVDVENLTCNIGGANDVILLGSGENLLINILDGTKVTAEHYKAEHVIIKGNIYNNSSFYASKSLECPPNERNSITLYGDAELKEIKAIDVEKVGVSDKREENTSNPQ